MWRDPIAWCALTAGLLTLHTMVNALILRRPSPVPSEQAGSLDASRPRPGLFANVDARVAVLLPLRDEAHRVEPCLRALLAQTHVPGLRIVALDDGSTDGTAAIVETMGVEVLTGTALPPGWLGKPHACAQLAATASDADVLVFVDADVVLAPHAVAAAVCLLDESGAALLSPYPKIVASTAGERIVQPLLQWSWLTFLPLRLMERSRRASLVAAGGQFLVVRRDAYERAGGHAAVRDKVLEDIELARAVKRSGGRVVLADGSTLATCRMYGSWRELADGYTKSLWASFGSPVGAAAVVALLIAVYVAPFAAMLGGSLAGAAGYGFGVLSRLISARATGGRAVPDALAHPASVLAFAYLVARSYARRRTVTWKGRPVA
jgi:cellulose synthase/poly-beta-1,6-N-acetylglucosamine synthase-like glycosyltransferase